MVQWLRLLFLSSAYLLALKYLLNYLSMKYMMSGDDL